MKINGTGPATGIQAYDRDGRGAAKKTAQDGSDPAARVSISPTANFVSTVQAEAADAGDGIRQDLVAEIKAQLMDGTFESKVDWDQAVGSLLADL